MSNILFIQFSHLTKSLNGAENYHHQLAKVLQAKGHTVNVVSHAVHSEGVFDGVPFYPAAAEYDLHCAADIIVTTPGKVRIPHKGKRYIFIQHNQNKEPWDVSFGSVIYCARHVAQSVRYRCLDSAVLWPFNRYVDATPLPANPGGKITLVNCNHNKGGHTLAGIAKVMQDRQFLGIESGYGRQIRYTLQNIEYREGSYDLREVLKDTSIVIMPSDREGLPTLALECASLGVPVLMSIIPAAAELSAWQAHVQEFPHQLASCVYDLERGNTFQLAEVYKMIADSQLSDIFARSRVFFS